MKHRYETYRFDQNENKIHDSKSLFETINSKDERKQTNPFVFNSRRSSIGEVGDVTY